MEKIAAKTFQETQKILCEQLELLAKECERTKADLPAMTHAMCEIANVILKTV